MLLPNRGNRPDRIRISRHELWCAASTGSRRSGSRPPPSRICRAAGRTPSWLEVRPRTSPCAGFALGSVASRLQFDPSGELSGRAGDTLRPLASRRPVGVSSGTVEHYMARASVRPPSHSSRRRNTLSSPRESAIPARHPGRDKAPKLTGAPDPGSDNIGAGRHDFLLALARLGYARGT